MMIRVYYWYLMLSVASSLLLPALAEDFQTAKDANWHQWRGPDANGVSETAKPPLEWGPEKNIQWKVPIEGEGSSTPIVWGDRVFLLMSIDTGKVDPKLPKPEDQPERPFGITFPNTMYQFVVLCLDRNTGREIWRRTAIEKIPHEGHHGDNNFASYSPTTDGKRLYAWFGSAGVYCYDLNGELLWSRDLGEVSTRRSFGEGSSPVVHGNRLVINRDNEGQSYVIVLNAETGETVWKQNRDEESSWATPLVLEAAGKTQVIVNASNRVRSYDLEDGALIWECGGQVGNVTPCPVSENGFVYCMSGYRGNAAFAIPLSAEGDITNAKQTVWSLNRGTPYVPSPVLYDGLLYFNQSNNGILTCVDAKTGKVVIERTRMEGVPNMYASPVGADGRVYFVSRDGTTLVIARDTGLKVLAVNRLGEDVDASPALAGNQLFIRGKKHLYCIAEK
jgi:outer membrane protein assembly factor BamB